MKTAQIMKELFELRGKGGDKSDKQRSKIIDFSSLNEDKKKKIEEFNTMYDNTMLQMGDESEQITMDNTTFVGIVSDPKTKARSFTPYS